jgi:methyl-accepting chemotaxis protein
MARTNYTIGKKLLLSFGAVLIAAITMAALSLITIARINASSDEVVNRSARKMVVANTLDTSVSDLIGLSRGMMLRAFLKDSAGIDKYHADYGKEVSDMKAALAVLAPLIKSPRGVQLLGGISQSVDTFDRFGEQMYQKAAAGDLKDSIAVQKDEFLPFATTVRTQVEVLMAYQSEVMTNSASVTKDIEAQSVWLTIVVTLVCLALGVVVTMVVRQINSSLRSCVDTLRDGAQQIAAAAQEVSSSSQSLAQGASEQAASIEETSASSAEINAMARRNTENSQTTASMVSESTTQFEHTNRELLEMVAAMDGISASSEQISKIIKVIDQIASRPTFWR